MCKPSCPPYAIGVSDMRNTNIGINLLGKRYMLKGPGVLAPYSERRGVSVRSISLLFGWRITIREASRGVIDLATYRPMSAELDPEFRTHGPESAVDDEMP